MNIKQVKILLLAAVLCIGLFPTAAFASDEKILLVLGDSISTGYGLKNAAVDSFPALLVGGLGAEYVLENKAVNGETTSSLLNRMKTEEYQATVESAAVITHTNTGNEMMA